MSLKKEYEENGLLCLENIISIDTIDKINFKIETFKRENQKFLEDNNLFKDNKLHRVINFHILIDEIKDIYVEILEKINQIFYQDTTFWSSIYFETGSEQPLHRDLPYFYTGEINTSFGCWVALEDININNGPLLAIKGSHLVKQPDLNKIRDLYFPNEDVPSSDNNLFEHYNKEVRTMCGKLEKVEYSNIPKGSLIIWHINTLHGGKEHIDKKLSRKSLVFHLTPKNKFVGHLDYFFSKNKKLPNINFEYEIYKNQLIKKNHLIDFAHIVQKTKEELIA